MRRPFTCADCPYCEKWAEDAYAHCHFEDLTGGPDWLNIPPCEEIDYIEEDE